MSTGFSCSKNTLLGLNVVYLMVSFLLIGVATYGKTSNVITSLPLLGGIVASGVFLLFVAVFGLVATVRHHQLWLFVYMVVLSIIFVIQFSVACACLGVSKEYELSIAEAAWKESSNATILNAEKLLGCCGFKNNTERLEDCAQVPACVSPKTFPNPPCPPCAVAIDNKIEYAFEASGGLGLFFSFTEIVGIIGAYKYRNLASFE